MYIREKKRANANRTLLVYQLSSCWLRISDALRDLVPFVQIGKHKKHPWRGVTK